MSDSLPARALLFDLDGVLVDSTAAIERTWRGWAEANGIDAEALLRVVHGRRAIDTIREVAPHLDAEHETFALATLEATDTAGVVRAPGAELLCTLPDARWAIVTSGVRVVALARLGAANLPEPPVLVPAEDIVRGKPDPQGYLAAAERLGVAATECVVFEDAPAGVAAARAAGMRCVAVRTTHAADALSDATWQAASLEDVRITVRENGFVVARR